MWKNVILLVAKKVEFFYRRIYVPSTVDADLQGMRKSASMAACYAARKFFKSHRKFLRKSKISRMKLEKFQKSALKVTNITIRAYKYNNHNIKICIMWQCYIQSINQSFNRLKIKGTYLKLQ